MTTAKAIMFTLRYVVEMKNSPTFTATKKVGDEIEALLRVEGLMKANVKAGYVKYSNFKLYDYENNIVATWRE